MKILMIAPEPCFMRRGTPMSVLARCRALTELGHTVDLVTYLVMAGIIFVARNWFLRLTVSVIEGMGYCPVLLFN